MNSRRFIRSPRRRGNAVLAESPDFLDQAVVELALATCASGTLRSPHGRGGIRRGCAERQTAPVAKEIQLAEEIAVAALVAEPSL
jgi:hypothetical protein